MTDEQLRGYEIAGAAITWAVARAQRAGCGPEVLEALLVAKAALLREREAKAPRGQAA